MVKSMTVPGKCSAISDNDWQVFPKKKGIVVWPSVGINLR
jgi:hypothetical protein